MNAMFSSVRERDRGGISRLCIPEGFRGTDRRDAVGVPPNQAFEIPMSAHRAGSSPPGRKQRDYLSGPGVDPDRSSAPNAKASVVDPVGWIDGVASREKTDDPCVKHEQVPHSRSSLLRSSSAERRSRVEFRGKLRRTASRRLRYAMAHTLLSHYSREQGIAVRVTAKHRRRFPEGFRRRCADAGRQQRLPGSRRRRRPGAA